MFTLFALTLCGFAVACEIDKSCEVTRALSKEPIDKISIGLTFSLSIETFKCFLFITTSQLLDKGRC